LIWLLFGLKGRISRKVYWLAYAFLICLQSALMAQILETQIAAAGAAGTPGFFGGWAGDILLAVSLYSTFAVSVKRLHDAGYADIIGLAIIIPFINFAFAVWLGIIPGETRPNRYGDAPDLPV
jgi:uncharacterized membrane protein YhaH (DUF805 family)